MSDPLDQKEYFIDTALQVKNFGSNTMPVFGGIKKSDNQAENKYASMEMKEYVEFCRAYLGPNFLTEQLLQARKNYFLQDAGLKFKFPGGTRICLAPIPCSENGFELEADEIKNGMYLRTLTLDELDLAKTGFSRSGSNIFKLLPLEIREQLTFTVPPYQTADENDITATDRENFVKLYEEKFRAAQVLFLGDLSK